MRWIALDAAHTPGHRAHPAQADGGPFPGECQAAKEAPSREVLDGSWPAFVHREPEGGERGQRSG